MNEYITLKLTKEDLEGNFIDNCNCPIARAARRQLGIVIEEEMSVCTTHISVGTGEDYRELYEILDLTGKREHIDKCREQGHGEVFLQKI